MPQVFQVLRCYKCFVFQVHQTKKSNKWECKLCGEKQSIKRHYGLGTAKDCRLHVQKLNGTRGELDQIKNKDLEIDNSENEENVTQPRKENYKPIKDSKWSNYIEEIETVEENTNENMSLGDAPVILELPKKRRKLNMNNFKRNPKLTTIAVDHRKIHDNDENHIVSNLKHDIVPNTIANTISIQSKSTLQSFQPDDLITEEPIKKFFTLKNKFIPPSLNQNSKWAQFTEDSEESEQTDIAPSPNTETSQNDLLFSLCDDTDLDNVLNI